MISKRLISVVGMVTLVTCAEKLIFEDNFDKFNMNTWEHELTMGGGGNWEFEWYVNNRSNSFVKDGKLHLKPTLTEDVIGINELRTGTVDIWG